MLHSITFETDVLTFTQTEFKYLLLNSDKIAISLANTSFMYLSASRLEQAGFITLLEKEFSEEELDLQKIIESIWKKTKEIALNQITDEDFRIEEQSLLNEAEKIEKDLLAKGSHVKVLTLRQSFYLMSCIKKITSANSA